MYLKSFREMTAAIRKRAARYGVGCDRGATGAGTQVLSRGKTVRIPAESVLTFRLKRELSVAGTH